MNRRHFLGQVAFGSTVVSLAGRRTSAQSRRGLRIKFIGMMGYVSRSDDSMLIAMPGEHRMGQYSHIPFLMARAGSPIASALGLTAMPGVVAGAFDMSLADVPSDAFVFRCLDGAELEVTGTGARSVANRTTQLAQMQTISPGKRLRSNLRRWAQASVTLEGGLLADSAAHPDAGKVWTFGRHRQRLTDATLFTSGHGTVRLNAGTHVATFNASAGAPAELWVVSSAGPRYEAPNPKRLEHGHLLFEFFADAEPVTPTCEDAEGRMTVATDLPCVSQMASMRGGAARMAPPYTDLCPGGGWCCE